jgi:hypothetical protein
LPIGEQQTGSVKLLRRLTVKNLLYRLIAVLLGFGVAFGLSEIGVRAVCPQETGPPRFAFDLVLGEIPVPNQKGRPTHPGGANLLSGPRETTAG